MVLLLLFPLLLLVVASVSRWIKEKRKRGCYLGEVAEGEDGEEGGFSTGTVTDDDKLPSDDILVLFGIRHG